MPTKNIDVREEVYEHLRAHKRENERVSDTIERLLTAVDSDWQTNFGFLDGETGEEFAAVVTTERERFGTDIPSNRSVDAVDSESGE